MTHPNIKQIGDLGEKLSRELMPSASYVDRPSWDLLGLDGSRIECKCSSYLPDLEGWRFKLSYDQVINSTHVLLLGLSPAGKLASYWFIPTDEINSREIEISEVNLADFAKFLVEVRNNE